MAHAHNHFGAEKVVRGETPHASADMNVTPLIDVLLVLLIIFMAALPLTQKGVDINLPLETKAPTEVVENTQVMLEYTADRQIPINHQPVTLPELESKLRDIFETRKEKTMFIAGDGTLRYGDIVAVIDAAKGAGIQKVGIVTEDMRKGGSARRPAATSRAVLAARAHTIKGGPSRVRPFRLFRLPTRLNPHQGHRSLGGVDQRPRPARPRRAFRWPWRIRACRRAYNRRTRRTRNRPPGMPAA